MPLLYIYMKQTDIMEKHSLVNLLREATEKAPYFKNIYGGIGKVTPKNAAEVEKTMSRILKKPVKLASRHGYDRWDYEMGDRSELHVTDDRWDMSYSEFVNKEEYGGTGWRIRIHIPGVRVATWGVENGVPWSYYHTHDDAINADIGSGYGASKSRWDYYKVMEAGKTYYLVGNIDRKLANNANLRTFKPMTFQLQDIVPRDAPWFELIPGTKAYAAVKQKIFKE